MPLKCEQIVLALIIILFAWNTYAENNEKFIATVDLSTDQNFLFKVVIPYRSENLKPVLPFEVRELHTKAIDMVKQGQLQQAADLYAKGLDIAPWWSLGHYDRAVLMAVLKQYPQAIIEMNRCLALTPNSPNAEMAQNMISQWKTLENQQKILENQPAIKARIK